MGFCTWVDYSSVCGVCGVGMGLVAGTLERGSWVLFLAFGVVRSSYVSRMLSAMEWVVWRFGTEVRPWADFW